MPLAETRGAADIPPVGELLAGGGGVGGPLLPTPLTEPFPELR